MKIVLFYLFKFMINKMSDSESETECALCWKPFENWTPYCHEPLCEDCYGEFVFAECTIDGCEYNDIEICKACLDVSDSYLCEICKEVRCAEHRDINCNCSKR